MKVKDLIELLKQCDPELPIATHANNHEYMSGIDSFSHGKCRVCLLHTYGGDHIVIGNISKKNLNKHNWYVIKELDELGHIEEEWRRY